MKQIFITLFILILPLTVHATETKTAIFAGGCFWCMESDFQDQKGIVDVVSGFAGAGAQPTYKQVSAGGTGFKEVISVTYDPAIVSYNDLLNRFWANVDPLDDAGQFCDKGDQYKSAIYYADENEKKIAEKSLAALEKKLDKKIVTTIEPFKNFYPAEDYHQDYYKTNSLKYKFYRGRCGRDARLKELNINKDLVSSSH